MCSSQSHQLSTIFKSQLIGYALVLVVGFVGIYTFDRVTKSKAAMAGFMDQMKQNTDNMNASNVSAKKEKKVKRD
jgi:hypothetical protein